jgi:hypothetical protein
MKHKVRICATLLLLILSGAAGLRAQTYYHHDRAIDFVLNGQVDSARKEIDLQMQQPGSDKDADVLQWRGIIYYELYKRYEVTNTASPFRDTAFTNLSKSLTYDTVSARVQMSRDYLKSIASRFYNDAVATLDTVNHATAVRCYLMYRKAVVLSDPKFDIRKKDIEFYLALASTYYTIYNTDKRANATYFDSTRNTYMHVLTIDPNNYSANYNLGVLFWNKGVDLMYDIDYDDSLGMVFDVQDRSVELFKQSLPFAEKAYVIEPKREETLIVLSGIYYSLNEFEKSDKYKQMLDNLRNQPKKPE